MDCMGKINVYIKAKLKIGNVHQSSYYEFPPDLNNNNNNDNNMFFI